MDNEKTILALLHQLAEVGIWLQRKKDGTVIIGPTDRVAKHRDLVEQVRPYKEEISRIIEDQLVHTLFGESDDDPRFESDICPKCEQRVYVMAPNDGENTSTRRLSVHRLPDGKSVCTGGGLAATVEVSELLDAFIKDCATELPSALVGWRSLWSEFRAWSYEHMMLPLPAPKALQEAMNKRFVPITNPNGLAWGGLLLKRKQWTGDKHKQPVKTGATIKPKLTQQLKNEQKQLTFEA